MSSIKPIQDVAAAMGLHPDDLVFYGRSAAKVSLSAEARAADRPRGKYIIVSAVTPTAFGEGKTVTSISLAQGLCHTGRNAIVCLRQPSLGPIFGIKGGGAGGGRATVEPRVDINLNLTGDLHAVAAAHNLLAAAVDAHIFHGNSLGVARVTLRRVLDVNDRALRDIHLEAGSKKRPFPRDTGFDITAASEVMAVLALASDVDDLKLRLGRIVIGFDQDGAPIHAAQLKVAGAMTALLKDTILPNLVQTQEGTPAFVHAGPFANIAHGNSSIVSDRIALRYADYVVTEGGFGTDLGLEKFMHIKCATSGLTPDCAVVVTTVRALKSHGGATDTTLEDLDALRRGASNLRQHIQNALAFKLPVVVALNRFPADTEAELALSRELALEAGARHVELSEGFARGGEGAAALAEAVAAVCEGKSQARPLYRPEQSLLEKAEIIATTLYGAEGIDVAPEAAAALAAYEAQGWGHLPVCMAKTAVKLLPEGPRVRVREVRPLIGAGFITLVCGDIMLMPGLPAHAAYERVDLVDGEVVGV